MEAALRRELPRALGAPGVTVQCLDPVPSLRVLEVLLPWSGQRLRWQVLQDLARPDLAPDIVCCDAPGFSPLLDAINNSGGDATTNPDDSNLRQELVQRLKGWSGTASSSSGGGGQAAAIAAVLQLLLKLFFSYQRARLAALGDERVAFELGMLEDTGCSQLLLTDEKDPAGGPRACFGIPLRGLDLTPARQLMCYLAATQPQPQTQPQAGATAAAAAAASGDGVAAAAAGDGGNQDWSNKEVIGDGEFVLSAAFRIGPGTSHAAPALQLTAPPWYSAAGLPPLQLPPWNAQAPLLEYVPLVTERLQQHLVQHCPGAVARFQLVEALSNLLGPPLEVRMATAAPNSPSTPSPGAPSYSSITGGSGAAGAAAAVPGGGGAGLSVAAFTVVQDGLPLLLFVEITPKFPEEAPALALQGVRRTGAEAVVSYRSYPWSPRWPVDEMAARLFNFIKQEAPAAARKLAGAA